MSLAYGTLVGSIDNNFFAIGTNFAGDAIATGELKLWYWDSNNFDNEESILLTVITGNLPEPSIIALMGLGLARLGFVRRRKLET